MLGSALYCDLNFGLRRPVRPTCSIQVRRHLRTVRRQPSPARPGIAAFVHCLAALLTCAPTRSCCFLPALCGVAARAKNTYTNSALRHASTKSRAPDQQKRCRRTFYKKMLYRKARCATTVATTALAAAATTTVVIYAVTCAVSHAGNDKAHSIKQCLWQKAKTRSHENH